MIAPGWRSVRLLVAPVVLGLLVWQIGHGPFVEGVAALDATALVLGVALSVPATIASAWRWRVVAGALGARLDLAPAVAACWSSQFLNSTLPAGIAGDVHRGLCHAPRGDRLLGLRAVAWERGSAQLVQVALATAAVLAVPTALVASASWSSPSPTGVLAVALLAVVVAATAQRLLRHRVLRADLARLRATGALPVVVSSSLVAQACFVATGLVAARAVGVAAPVSQLVPLLLVMLVAMALPVGVAGWGPREGAAAWCFAAAGLGADAGVSTAVAYGVLVTVASLPGAVVLARASRRTHDLAVEGASRA